MLGKMIKHEFRATARLFLPMFIFIAALTPILGVLFRVSRLGVEYKTVNIFSAITAGISISSYALLLFAVYTAAFIFIAIRYYRTTATSEAYLTFCLPVNPHQILISKLLVGFVWQTVTAVIITASVYVMVIIQGVIRPGELLSWLSKEFFNMDPSDYAGIIRIIVHLCLIFMVGLIFSMLQYFLAITLGQLFNEHRVIASIGMYVAIYTCIQFISTLVLIPIIVLGENIATHYDFNQLIEVPIHIYDVLILESLVLSVVFYFVTALLLKKRLNVR